MSKLRSSSECGYGPIQYLIDALQRAAAHTGEFPRGVGHRVENGWGLTKVAVVLLNGLIW